MLEFYRKFALALLLILLCSSGVIYQSFYQSKYQTMLLPRDTSSLIWRGIVSSDMDDGGNSTYSLTESTYNIDFTYQLAEGVEYPYVSFALRFVQQEKDILQHVDLTRYNTVRFRIRCNPTNILTFTVYTFDEGVTVLDDLRSYRIPSTYFACDRSWKDIEVDLNKLETPEWWLKQHATLASRNYSLAKTASLTIGNSVQSPLDTKSHVAIDSLVLEGRNWMAVTAGAAVLVLIWIVFIFWSLKCYTRALTSDVRGRLQKDISFIGYQQLSIEPHKDKERSALLGFMVTEYQNPELDMEAVIQKLGMNKSKINEILKRETGLTFNVYLNKLRLTEAARLLSENHELNIGEVAYSVGYNNVSYFNRLFKGEYGCTPKAFKSLKLDKSSETE